LRDGPAALAHLAQPSGLSLLADGSLAFADSEVSALRLLRDGMVQTLVGTGLFDWGDEDGDADHARLQHPLGVAALSDGGIAVADTFNGRLRLYRDATLSTISVDTSLNEPGGLDVLPDGRLIVADTNNHRILVVDVSSGATHVLPITGLDGAASGASVVGAPGAVIQLAPPTVDLDGHSLDPGQGPPVRLTVSADPPELLAAGPRAWALADLEAPVAITLGQPGKGTITIDLVAATCNRDVCTVHRASEKRDLSVQTGA
ncbi:MAG: alkyl hydroperoxide reductase, partial [Candidatus Dormibacteria bacterium]